MNRIESHKLVSLAFDRGTLLLKGLGHTELRDSPGSSIWAWDSRVGAWRCDAFHYAQVSKVLGNKFGASFSDEVTKLVDITWPKIALPKLRPEQLEALEAWIRAGQHGQIIMPTGTGKTEIALAAMAQTKIATLVVAPVRDLITNGTVGF